MLVYSFLSLLLIISLICVFMIISSIQTLFILCQDFLDFNIDNFFIDISSILNVASIIYIYS